MGIVEIVFNQACIVSNCFDDRNSQAASSNHRAVGEDSPFRKCDGVTWEGRVDITVGLELALDIVDISTLAIIIESDPHSHFAVNNGQVQHDFS